MTTAPVTELLERLHKSGVQLRTHDGEVFYSPRSAMTPELLSSLSDQKPEVLAALDARPTPPSIEDGCTAHTVTADAVAERWAEVQRRDFAPGFCACCSGPAHPQTLVCRLCEALTAEREAELTEPPPCARCGAQGYPCGASSAWYCESCWKASR